MITSDRKHISNTDPLCIAPVQVCVCVCVGGGGELGFFFLSDFRDFW